MHQSAEERLKGGVRAGNICIASAVYRTACSCSAEVAVERGESCPPCPECGQPVDLIFVRSSFVPVSVPDGPVPPESPLFPRGLRGLIRDLRTGTHSGSPLASPGEPATPSAAAPPPPTAKSS